MTKETAEGYTKQLEGVCASYSPMASPGTKVLAIIGFALLDIAVSLTAANVIASPRRGPIGD